MLYKKAQQEEIENLRLERKKLEEALNPNAEKEQKPNIRFYGEEKS